MKTFSEFQEEMNKKVPPVMSLGGGGGGTDSITDAAPYKSFKKRVIDAGKMATVPARFLLNIKSKPDPTEKFADSYKTPKEKVSSAIRDYKKQKKVNEGVAALALKGGSKLIPALMTGIGAAGTIMQARKYRTRNNPEGKRKKRKLGPMEKSYHKKELGDRSNDMIVARRGEADKQNKLIDKYEKKYTSQQQKNTRRNIIRGLKGGNIQDEFSAPTNSMGGGAIAGSVEAGDNPPVNKKKKKGEPTIIARGCMPGARGRFKGGVELLASFKKNKYT